MILSAFAPTPRAASNGFVDGVTLSATNTSSTATLPSNPQNATSLQIANQSAAWAYIQVGLSTVPAATANSYPVAPGAVVVISVSPSSTTVAGILSTGTGSVSFIWGEGI